MVRVPVHKCILDASTIAIPILQNATYTYFINLLLLPVEHLKTLDTPILIAPLPKQVPSSSIYLSIFLILSRGTTFG
jgi:hypothetical protein